VTSRAFFARWLARSLRGTLASGAVATASLALSSALVFASVAVSAGVEGQLGRELRGFGANLLVVPRRAPLRVGIATFDLGTVAEERGLPTSDLARLPAEWVEASAPALLLRVRVEGQDAGAVGYDLAALRAMNPHWRIAPRWPEGPREAAAGATLAARLGLGPGREVTVAAGERTARVAVTAVVETGGAEDEDLLLPLSLAQDLAARPGEASLALVRARLAGRSAEEAARAIEAAVPGAEARTIRQVASAEDALLGKVRRMLALVTAALAAATAFTVAGTLGVVLLGRRREIGLCLALGAAPASLRALLLSEAAASGLAGGVAGCLLGAIASEAVAWSVFGVAIPIAASAPAAALATSVAVALGASLWPVHRAVRVSPCDTLRAQ
jgi:putative ABC transport system permease protein